MSTPLHKTFDLLSSTGNPGAVDILVSALDLEPELIRLHALHALMKREALRGQIEVIRRLKGFSDAAYAAVIEHASRMHVAVRHCLLHGEAELRREALEIVQTAECYDQTDALLELLQKDDNELAVETLDVFVALMRQLYDRCASGRNDLTAAGRKISDTRQKVLTQLIQHCANFKDLATREEVLTALLALGNPDHLAVKKLFTQRELECREHAGRLMLSSTHPGVIQLVLDGIGKDYPHARMFEAIQHRDDLPFVEQLLKWFPRKPTQTQRKNLGQIESIAWLHPDHPILEQLDGALQMKLVHLMGVLGLTNDARRDVQEWLVRHGGREGRLAASNVLSTLDDSAVEHIIFNSLISDDEEIQAWATSQLREQKIPETFSLLIERLDSELPAVREAAREELSSFDIETMLGLFDHLDPETCRRAGEIILKIDPECPEKLSRKLAAPIRRKRIRAARACRSMGLHEHVIPALLAMLEDSESLVRRTGLEVLEGVCVPEVVAAVQLLTEDPSPRVRETAEKTLRTLRYEPGSFPA